MKKLLIKLLVLVALLVTLIIAPNLVGEKGYVLFSYGGYAIEMTVISFLITLSTVTVIGFFGAKFARVLLSLFYSPTRWLGTRKGRLQTSNLNAALSAYLLDDFADAQTHSDRIQGANFNGMNHLLGAKTYLRQGKFETASKQLALAKTYPATYTAALLMEADIALAQNNGKAALNALAGIDTKARHTSAVVTRYAAALAANNDWRELETKLPKWKKALGDDYAQWANKIAAGKLSEVASKEGANELKTAWAALPRKTQKDVAYQRAYVEQLLAQDMFKDAESALVSYQKKGPEAALLPLFKQLRLPNPASSLSALESWIKVDLDNAELYSTLGHVAFYSGDAALAEKALVKAQSLNPTQQDTLLLAKLYEQQALPEQALRCYQSLVQANA